MASRVEHAPTRPMFDRLAKKYNRGNRIISLGQDLRWKRLAVSLLQPAPGGRYLDCGAGTGDLTRLVLSATQGKASVVALDASSSMLKQGNLFGMERVEAIQGDALVTNLATGSFDGVVSGFLLRNLPDLPGFFREMSRLLKPGGNLVVLEVAYPAGRLRRRIFSAYFHGVAPVLGALATGDWAAYRYLSGSLRGFATPGQLGRMAEAAGLVETRRNESGWLGMFVASYAKPGGSVGIQEKDKKPSGLGAGEEDSP